MVQMELKDADMVPDLGEAPQVWLLPCMPPSPETVPLISVTTSLQQVRGAGLVRDTLDLHLLWALEGWVPGAWTSQDPVRSSCRAFPCRDTQHSQSDAS